MDTTDTQTLAQQIADGTGCELWVASVKINEAVEALDIEVLDQDWDGFEVSDEDADRIAVWAGERI